MTCKLYLFHYVNFMNFRATVVSKNLDSHEIWLRPEKVKETHGIFMELLDFFLI